MSIHLGRKNACRSPGDPLRIARRIGLPPRSRDSHSGSTCPDVFELTDGRFAVIGTEETTKIQQAYPDMRELNRYEIVVVVDRETLTCARAFIPDK
ncbi:hypothetical protein OG223_38780 [Streptomyces sp. NBC_01478]|uniref:hypothetical protein n=1 Tax=Streptomyces sp. NBC_01478 TaxID=2903882 RepID=UPI002E34BCF4|nr:hypothetical protein [Streptomyces sp. NBC_01478]